MNSLLKAWFTGILILGVSLGVPAGTSPLEARPLATAPPFAAPTITSIAPTSGGVGAAVTITGTNLTGTSSVSFNGIAAIFGTVTATSIATTVPPSATTGTIVV